jgi:CcmD family protein
MTLVLLLSAGTSLVGQVPGPSVDEFVPVPDGVVGHEQLPATPLVFSAYAVVWLILIAYVFLLWRRLGKVERELASLSIEARNPRR